MATTKQQLKDAATNLRSATEAFAKAALDIDEGIGKGYIVLEAFQVCARANSVLKHAEDLRDALLDAREQGL